MEGSDSYPISKRINYDYLGMYLEIPFLIRASTLQPSPKKINSSRTLIVTPCLIGDFAATIPAIKSFINNSKNSIDLVVSPPVKTLAESIQGVNNVFVAKSIFGRKNERLKLKNKIPQEYDELIILRLSKDTFNLIKDIKFNRFRNSLKSYINYGFHLIKNGFTKGKTRQWSDFNYEVLEEKPSKFKFNELFNFKSQDYSKIKKMPEFRTKDKIVLIHTGSGWPMKLWEKEKWVELVNDINQLGNFRFIFIGGNEELKDFNFISKSLDFKVYSLINKLDIKELMITMKLSNYLIGVDSGPRNMAHLADLRCLVLLGPGVRNFMPLSKKDIVIDPYNLKKMHHIYLYSKDNELKKVPEKKVLESFKKLIKN